MSRGQQLRPERRPGGGAGGPVPSREERSRVLRQQLGAIAMVVCVVTAAVPQPLRARPMPQNQPRPAAQGQPAGGLQLKVRRLPDAVELVLAEAGLGASLTQQPFADRWQGELRTDRPRVLQVGPQALTLPAEGLERISFDGSGSTFRLLVTPTPGRLLPSPVVSSDGRDLVVRFPAAPNVLRQTVRPSLTQPTPVPTQTFVPPLRPRAVAPPVGDMAVGTMTLRNRGTINLSGPPVTMTTRGANASNVLMELARMGRYGFVAVPDSKSCALGVAKEQGRMMLEVSAQEQEKAPDPRVTLSFSKENYSRAFNAVLRAAGWGGVIEGNTIYAGKSVVCDSFGRQITRVIRLNQADPESAVSYLATLGALGKRPNQTTILTTSGPTAAERQPGQDNEQQKTELLEIELYRAPTGPLLGLEASFDKRLGLVTLTGEPSLVAIGEQYLRQFDLRRRQVALAITILDVDLSSDSGFTTSFAYRSGDNFIVNDAGRLFGNIGNTGQSPPFNAPDGDFVGFLRAQIESRNAKILANPTLIIQEGEATRFEEIGTSTGKLKNVPFGSLVTVGSSIIVDFEVTTNELSGSTCKPITGINGLTMYATVSKVDDNGFVTFNVSPVISAPAGTQLVPGCGVINFLNRRDLVTTNVRVRDGQTLILTGVISDEDKAVVTKWPILGDTPLIGSIFRSSGRSRSKRELVILVTPRIIDDEQGGAYAYGYRPVSDDARQLIYGSGSR